MEPDSAGLRLKFRWPLIGTPIGDNRSSVWAELP